MEIKQLEQFREEVTSMPKLFKVEYALHCFVKHDAWNEFGQGSSRVFPIEINPEPGQLSQFYNAASIKMQQ